MFIKAAKLLPRIYVHLFAWLGVVAYFLSTARTIFPQVVPPSSLIESFWIYRRFRDIKMLSWGRHRAVFTVNLSCRTRRMLYPSPIRWWSDISKISIIYLCWWIHSAFASTCRFVYCTWFYLSHAGDASRRYKSILYCRTSSHYIITRCRPPSRSRRLSAFDR